MGLAGRKAKQRIGADPRNLSWSDDSSKFGAKYLQSLGWTSGTGLGVSGEGRTSNLKIHQKLDLMGIGANRRGPGGDDAGWRGAREFEGLLARLNEAQNADTQDIPIDDEDATDANDSVAGRPTKGVESVVANESTEVNDHSLDTIKETERDTEQQKKKKRKRDTAEDEETVPKEEKRRRKKEEKEQRRVEKAGKRMKKKSRDSNHEIQVASVGNKAAQDTGVMKTTPRVRAHRARNLASKRLAAASATGMNEILGMTTTEAVGQTMEVSSNFQPKEHPVASDTGQIETPGLGLVTVKDQFKRVAETNNADATRISSTGLGFGSSKQRTTDAAQEDDRNSLLQRSGKSVAEYFAEKLRMKSVTKGAVVPQDVGNPQGKNRKKGKQEGKDI